MANCGVRGSFSKYQANIVKLKVSTHPVCATRPDRRDYSASIDKHDKHNGPCVVKEVHTHNTNKLTYTKSTHLLMGRIKATEG